MTARQKRQDFDVLVALDDSPSARAVTAATATFPWPGRSRAHGVVATHTRATTGRPTYVRLAFERAFRHVAERAQRALGRRWPGMAVAVVDRPPVDAILGTAEKLGAEAIVVGWRGHGVLRRLFTGGSVSRAVVRRSRCPVLVVKGRAREVRRIVIGVDGSRNAARAAAFVARLPSPPGGRATLVAVVEPLRLPSLALVPSMARAPITREIRAENASRVARARRDLDRLVPMLRRAGWRVETVVRTGVPVAELVDAARGADADVVVVGARGTGALRGLLLGSVAEGTLRHAGMNVLIVRSESTLGHRRPE